MLLVLGYFAIGFVVALLYDLVFEPWNRGELVFAIILFWPVVPIVYLFLAAIGLCTLLSDLVRDLVKNR